MYQVDFSPFTFELEIYLSEKISLKRWGDIVKHFFNIYAQEITTMDRTYIGHIKALFLLDEKTSIKLSIFKKNLPAEISINGEAIINNISLLVNSFVYGVDEEKSIIVLNSVIKQMEEEFLLKIVNLHTSR